MALTDAIRFIVVVPTLNERLYIEAALGTLRQQTVELGGEIWVLDGGSTDGTRDIVRAMHLPEVTLIANPGRNQANAMNLAAKLARERGNVEVLIRADAHALYPPDFIKSLLDALRHTGARSIVVPMTTAGGNLVQEAGSALYNSWLGNGGSPHRANAKSGFVEHGHHAAFDLTSYSTVGGYDPAFEANEDAEFDLRFRQAGYRVFLETKALVEYLPRNTYWGTWLQLFRNGRFRIFTAVKHRRRLALRQLPPFFLLPALIALTIFGLTINPLCFLGIGMYFTAIVILSFIACWRDKPCGPLKPFRIALLALLTHTAFSAGALWGLFRLYIACPGERDRLRGNRMPDPHAMDCGA